jgi:hypothetical protein
VDESPVKDRGDYLINGMLHHTVSESRGVYDTPLGLVHLELEIRARPVCASVQLLVQGFQVGAQGFFKFKAGPLAAFAFSSL